MSQVCASQDNLEIAVNDSSDPSSPVQNIFDMANIYEMSSVAAESMLESPPSLVSAEAEAEKAPVEEVRQREEGPRPETVKEESRVDDKDGANKKKKKSRGTKRSKSAAKRGPTALPKSRGTGFEEFYADPPMTAEEVKEEQNELYAVDIPFSRRMQTCIQRFRSRRRLQGDLTHFFNRYLFLGGVDCTPNSYGGWDPKDLKDLTAAERQEVLATDVIHDSADADERFYAGDDENWCVDFTGVAACFLCGSLKELTALEPEPLNDAVSVVENFLKYVLHHDVCPEYEEDVLQALDVCNLAREEWPMIAEMLLQLPGEFNLAATELFSEVRSDDWSFVAFSRRADFNPKAVFYSALATADNNTLFHDVCRDDLGLMREFDVALEFVSVVRPTADIVERFRMTVFSDDDGNDFTLKAIGKATLRGTILRDEYDQPDKSCPLGGREVNLYLEDDILAQVKPGMKMVARLGELSGGFHFLKTIRTVVPSFYVFLPQELMRHYKRPKNNERPAQSVHDPPSFEPLVATPEPSDLGSFVSEEQLMEEVDGGRRT